MANSSKSKYSELWRRYLPAIMQTIKNCGGDMRHILLNAYEFKLISNNKSYSFNLEYTDGKISNNISGSALAKDLAAVIEDSKEASRLVAAGHIKLRMDKKFCLWICRQENSNEMVFDFNFELTKNL
jgi:hypothetical protein